MFDELKQAYQKCIQSFVYGNYAECAQQVMPLLSTGVTPEMVQVLLISLQRRGQNDLVEQLSPQCLTMFPNHPWETALLKLTLGQEEPIRVLDMAQDDRQRCQARFYAGARLLTKGGEEEAGPEFLDCLATQARCLEFQLAKVEADFLVWSPNARVGPWIDSVLFAADEFVELLQRGNALCAGHQYQEAAGYLMILVHELRRLPSELTPEMSANLLRAALCSLGTCYYEMHNLAEARACLEEAVALARASGDLRAAAPALHELSMVLWKEGDVPGAIALCRESIDLVIERGEEPANALNTLAILYQENGQFAEARELLELVKESCEARHDLEGLGRALNELGLVTEQLGEVRPAVAYFTESIRIKRRIGNSQGMATTQRNLKACLHRHSEAMCDPQVERMLSELET